MKSLKEIKENAKNWVHEHKKGLITAGIGAAVMTVGAVLYGDHYRRKMNELRGETDHAKTELLGYIHELEGHCESASVEQESICEKESNWGRDCIMTFTVEETGEELGKVPCTETFAMECLDIDIGDDF